MSAAYTPKLGRRETLQWLAAATAALGTSPYIVAQAQQHSVAPGLQGYGVDPNLSDPVVPWSRTMTLQQLKLTAILADLILPASETAPAPSDLGVPDFVDEWISAPYPEQRADRAVIVDGLEWIEAEARRHAGREFSELDAAHRQRILAPLLPAATAVAAAQQMFFRRFRFVVVGAYFTTPAGLKDLGYIGNVPLASYPPVTAYERAILDAELRKLGVE